jgi:predicted nucleotidyltransferase
MNLLAEIVSSRVRAEFFRLLFGLDPAELHLREIVRASGCSVGTVQTEVKKLLRLDLVLQRRDGNRLYFRANAEHPLYVEIRGMVLKTVGLVDLLRDALGNCKDILAAFVFGSVAAQGEKAGSDIDLMVIGPVSPREVSRLLRGAAAAVSREINPFVLEADEFVRRRSEGDHFLTQVIGAPKIFIIGTEHDFEELGR